MRRMLGAAMAATVFLVGCGASGPTPSRAILDTPPANVAATPMTITAKDITLLPATLGAPAGSELDITFDNQDAGVPHNLALFAGPAADVKVFEGEITTGPATSELVIPGLVAGTYRFSCIIHPNMTAELRVS